MNNLFPYVFKHTDSFLMQNTTGEQGKIKLIYNHDTSNYALRIAKIFCITSFQKILCLDMQMIRDEQQ